MFVAYADRRGVIGFCHEQMTPSSTIVFANGDDLVGLQATVEVKARYSYRRGVLLVPGMPEADSDDEAIEALNRWAQWAFAFKPYLGGDHEHAQ